MDSREKTSRFDSDDAFLHEVHMESTHQARDATTALELVLLLVVLVLVVGTGRREYIHYFLHHIHIMYVSHLSSSDGI
jgi:hypothetical protein